MNEIERLRTHIQTLRRKPTPLADLIPLLTEAADALARKDALLREAMEAMADFRAGNEHRMGEVIAAIVSELAKEPT